MSYAKIIGRNKEINILDRIYKSKKSELVAIYGRRRVGKSYLVSECSSSPKWTRKKTLVRGLPEMVVLFFIFFRAKTCWFQFFIVTLPQTIIRQTWSTKDYHTECQTTHGLGSRITTVQTKPCIYRRWKKQETSSTSSVHADLARAFF